MAERRMFTKKVTDDDNFMSLSSSAQALYLHLSMSADDDGFCNQVSASMFKAHASVQDLQALLEKRYIYQFESGVIVIKHWRMANALRKDRYTPTAFQEELAKLDLKKNGSYTWLPNGCQMVAERLPQISIDKNSIDKDSIDSTIINDCSSDSKSDPKQKIIEMWNELSVFGIPPVKRISEGSKRMTQLRSRLKQFTLDDFAEAIEQIKQSSFLQGKNKQGWMITFDWFILPSNFSKVLEGNYSDKKGVKNERTETGVERYSSGNAERDREMDEIIRRNESGESDADDEGLWDMSSVPRDGVDVR